MMMNPVEMFSSLSDFVLSADIESLLNLNLMVDCSTWEEEAALDLFGPDWTTKKTPATISKVTGTRVGRLKFDLHFSEIDMRYVGFNWQYILKYLTSPIPAKFALMTEKVVPAPRKRAAAPSSQQPSAASKPKTNRQLEALVPEKNVDGIIAKEVKQMVTECCINVYAELSATAVFPLSIDLSDISEDEEPECVGNHIPLDSKMPAELSLGEEVETVGNLVPVDSKMSAQSSVDEEWNSAAQPSSDEEVECEVDTVQKMAGAVSVGAYFSRHSWMKAWGERSSALPKGNQLKERKVPVPKAPADCPEFKFPRTCALYMKLKKEYRLECPGMKVRNVTKDTQLICSQCLVFLHPECHTYYHMHYAHDRLLL
jgi:hypothetical protein